MEKGDYKHNSIGYIKEQIEKSKEEKIRLENQLKKSKTMKFIDIISEKLIGEKIDISDFNLEVEEGLGIRYAKKDEFSEKYALIVSIYEVASHEEFILGVHAYIEDKVVIFILTDTDEIKFE